MSEWVKILGDEQELQEKLKGTTDKLVVLEFVKPGSQICQYVETERNKIAQEMKDKAEFCELNVDTFKRYAERLKVEALPAFVVMQKFVKKRHVVGTDDLRKAITDAYANLSSNMPEANPAASNAVESAGSQPAEQPAARSGRGKARGGTRRGLYRLW